MVKKYSLDEGALRMMCSLHDGIFRADYDLTSLKQLLATSPELTYERQNGCTLLHKAVVLGRFDLVEILIEARNSMINEADKDGYTPLHLVGETLWLKGGNDGELALRMAKMLLEAGASVERRNDQGQTPLLALFSRAGQQKGWLELLRLLLKFGADPNAQDNNGCTFLHYVANESNLLAPLESVQTILDSGAATHTRNKQGETPLDIAVARKDGCRIKDRQKLLELFKA